MKACFAKPPGRRRYPRSLKGLLTIASNMETALMLAAMTLLCILGSAVYGAVALLEWLVNLRYGQPRSQT